MENRENRSIKWVVVILFAALLVALAVAYGINMENRSNQPEEKAVKESPDYIEDAKASVMGTKKVRFLIGMSQCTFTGPFRTAMNNELTQAISGYPEFELTILDGAQDNSKQIADIEYFIHKKVDLLIVSPNEAKPLTAVVKKAYNAGIPVILLDRKIEGDTYTQFISADNVLIGQKAGEWIAEYLGEHGGNIVEIMGSDGTSAQIERHNGFMKGIEKNLKIKIIDAQSSDWLRDKAIDVMEKFLDKGYKIDLVFAHNDASAEGAYTAAKNAGKEKDMKFVGIDALPTQNGGIRSVIEGRINATFHYPSGAKEALESAYKLLVKEEKLQKVIKLDTIEITEKNSLEVYNRLKSK